MYQIASLSLAPCPCGQHLVAVYEQTSITELVPGVFQIVTLVAEGRIYDGQLVVIGVDVTESLAFAKMAVWDDSVDEDKYDDYDWRQAG